MIIDHLYVVYLNWMTIPHLFELYTEKTDALVVKLFG